MPCAQPHGTDLQDVYGPPGKGRLQDYLIRFAATLDPNSDGRVFKWPRYEDGTPRLLTLNDADPKLEVTMDDFREEAMDCLTQLSLVDPL